MISTIAIPQRKGNHFGIVGHVTYPDPIDPGSFKKKELKRLKKQMEAMPVSRDIVSLDSSSQVISDHDDQISKQFISLCGGFTFRVRQKTREPHLHQTGPESI